jgi:hypothetical protein
MPFLSPSGLPDGLFSNEKYKFGQSLEGVVMEEVCSFYGHLVYFTALYGRLVYFVVIWYIFPRFGRLYQEKSGNPGHRSTKVHHFFFHYFLVANLKKYGSRVTR